MPAQEHIKAMEALWEKQQQNPLSADEQNLLCAVIKGEECLLQDKASPQLSTIRSQFLQFLLSQNQVEFKFGDKGIHLQGARIICANSANKREPWLDLHNLTLTCNLKFSNCVIDGTLDLSNSDLKSLYFDQCQIKGIKLDDAEIEGQLHITNKCEFERDVTLSNINISGDLVSTNSEFASPQLALLCNRANIGGKVVLGGNSRYNGQVSFVNAQVQGDFSAQNGSFDGNPALSMRSAKINGIFHWRDIKDCKNALELSNMSCKALNFDENSWFMCSEVKLSNLTYEGFAPMPSNANGEFWCRWLDHQPESHLKQQFRPKPFEMLSQVLTNMGMIEEAIAVKIHKEKTRTQFMADYEPKPDHWFDVFSRRLRIFGRRWIYGALIAYGYRPSRAVYYLVAIGLLGGFIYWWAALAGIMTPAHPLIFKEAHAENGLIPKDCAKNWVYFPAEIAEKCSQSIPSEFSEFQPFMYSFDVLLPIINLRQEVDWAPRVVHHDGSDWLAGRLIRIWEWLEIAAGWLLSLLLVSAIGGIIRK